MKSVIDDFRLTEEMWGEEEKVEKVKANQVNIVGNVRYGRELPYTYANLVKNISLIFTFGLASPITAWIGCIGIMCRWLTLSFLAERYEKKMKQKGQEPAKTDAQGIPFRCIMLIVFCNFGFFSTAAIISGVDVEEDEKGGGAWTPVFLCLMIISLITQMVLLSKGSSTTPSNEQNITSENTSDEENPAKPVTSPVHKETAEIEMTAITNEKHEDPAIIKTHINENLQVEAASDDRKKKPPMIKNPSVKIRVSVTSLAKRFTKNSEL